MEERSGAQPTTKLIRFKELRSDERNDFSFSPNAEERQKIADFLNLLGLKKATLSGSINPIGKTDWELKAKIGATVSQPCVITLEPVTTRIDETVRRLYLKDLPVPEGDEVEMPENDEEEQLPSTLDLEDLFVEALSLSLPTFPRKESAELDETQFTRPGLKAMTDEDTRPFAGLSALREKLEKKSNSD